MYIYYISFHITLSTCLFVQYSIRWSACSPRRSNTHATGRRSGSRCWTTNTCTSCWASWWQRWRPFALCCTAPVRSTCAAWTPRRSSRWPNWRRAKWRAALATSVCSCGVAWDLPKTYTSLDSIGMAANGANNYHVISHCQILFEIYEYIL